MVADVRVGAQARGKHSAVRPPYPYPSAIGWSAPPSARQSSGGGWGGRRRVEPQRRRQRQRHGGRRHDADHFPPPSRRAGRSPTWLAALYAPVTAAASATVAAVTAPTLTPPQAVLPTSATAVWGGVAGANDIGDSVGAGLTGRAERGKGGGRKDGHETATADCRTPALPRSPSAGDGSWPLAAAADDVPPWERSSRVSSPR